MFNIVEFVCFTIGLIKISFSNLKYFKDFVTSLIKAMLFLSCIDAIATSWFMKMRYFELNKIQMKWKILDYEQM